MDERQSRSERQKKQNLICKNCGAEYAADIPNCPYCGAMNLPAAEKSYMNTLETIRGDLEGLGRHTARESRKHFRALGKKLLLAAVVLAVLSGVFLFLHIRRERAETEHDKAEYLWQHEGFAQLDALYEADDYEALAARYEEGKLAGHRMYQYKHSSFCEAVVDAGHVRQALESCRSGMGDPAWLLYWQLQLLDARRSWSLSAGEKDLLAQLTDPVSDDVYRYLQLTEEELQPLLNEMEKDYFNSYDACQQFLKDRGMNP